MGGLREGAVNHKGELVKNPDGRVWEQAGSFSVPCEVVAGAKKQGIECLYIYEFQRVKLGNVNGEHDHLYSYKVRDKKTGEFLWYYFSVPCKQCEYVCSVERRTAPVGAGVAKQHKLEYKR